jgi:hypothetical protein
VLFHLIIRVNTSVAALHPKFQIIYQANLAKQTGSVRIEYDLVNRLAAPTATSPGQNAALQVKGKKL